MFSNLQDRLEVAFKNLKGEGKITELNIAATIKEIRRALVEADVNYKTAKDFTEKIRVKTLGEKVLTSVNPSQLMVKIVKDEMTNFMGGTADEIDLKGQPAVVLISGLQGSGKTTFSAKLALHIKEKLGRAPMMVACDVYRPAAIDQLEVLGEQIKVEVYSERENKNPVSIAQNAIQHAKGKGYNVVIVDTAGRLAVDEEMMNEISNIKKGINPQETLFVVDAMTGQDAVNTAKAFNERIDFSGVVLTKLDGDTRGGAALSIKYTVNKPIKFVSRGEKLDTLDVFHPDRMAQRILGMGDIVSFVEKAQEQFDEKEAKKLEAKIKKNKFDFDDFLQQINQIRKMGNVKDLLGMIPGVGKAIRDVDIDDNAFKKIEAMIQSMTPAERGNPDLLNGNRRKRIAEGSGSTIQDVNQFIKQFNQMKKMMKNMSSMSGKGKMPSLSQMGLGK
ncbi:MAG: signal recognition particle protein [Bacteroidetes bacterium]|nr:signal recognition particle protein [Bacteroidota bacterium]